MEGGVRLGDLRPRSQPLGQRHPGGGVRRREVEDHAGQERARIQDRAHEEGGVHNPNRLQVGVRRPGLPVGGFDVVAQQALQCVPDGPGPAERRAVGGVEAHHQFPQEAGGVVLGQAGGPLPGQDPGRLGQWPPLGAGAAALGPVGLVAGVPEVDGVLEQCLDHRDAVAVTDPLREVGGPAGHESAWNVRVLVSGAGWDQNVPEQLSDASRGQNSGVGQTKAPTDAVAIGRCICRDRFPWADRTLRRARTGTGSLGGQRVPPKANYVTSAASCLSSGSGGSWYGIRTGREQRHGRGVSE
ncbi:MULTISPECIES: hypothetical protein [Streptomyces]|uniref:hypothetical protein n=1 Tax=Streptomyces TaxID=1883 RepID=UPI0015CF75FA|nr:MULTISPECIES: hypothetical protein [Streptomyces]MCX4508178.1 hypothetical protein [Streptomyces anulatus]